MNFMNKLKHVFTPEGPKYILPQKTHKLYEPLERNLEYLQHSFDGSADFTVRNMTLKDGTRAAILTIEGMTNKETLAVSIANPIILSDIEGETGEEKSNTSNTACFPPRKSRKSIRLNSCLPLLCPALPCCLSTVLKSGYPSAYRVQLPKRIGTGIRGRTARLARGLC